MDDDRSKTISREEFFKACNDFGVGIHDSDKGALFSAFDVNRNGTLDYEEFLRGVVGEMNQFRKNLTDRAFQILDKDGSGIIEYNDLKGVYNGKMHPEVIQGKKTE